MPLAMINHIETQKVLPTTDLPKAQDVESRGVVEENINFPLGYSIQSMAEQLAGQLHTKVMQRGIHPGHCAVVFDGGAAFELFPPLNGGLPAFVQLVNDNLRAIPVQSQAGHMLQISPNIGETLLYNRNARSTTATFATAYLAERHAEVILSSKPTFNEGLFTLNETIKGVKSIPNQIMISSKIR